MKGHELDFFVLGSHFSKHLSRSQMVWRIELEAKNEGNIFKISNLAEGVELVLVVINVHLVYFVRENGEVVPFGKINDLSNILSGQALP
jgi:hypothetical protein